jgi:Tfp pilus assembly protein PilZ
VPERRRYPRVRKRLRVAYGEHDLGKVGFTRDVSAGGMFVLCSGPLPTGSRLHVQVFLNEKDFLLMEGAQVYKKQVPLALRTSGEQGFGLRFLLPMEALSRVTTSEPLPVVDGPAGAPPPSEHPTFTVQYGDSETFSAAWQRELRHGGLFVVTEDRLERDQPVTIQLRLPFASLSLEVSGRVLQATSGATAGLSLGFTEPRRVLDLLASVAR